MLYNATDIAKSVDHSAIGSNRGVLRPTRTDHREDKDVSRLRFFDSLASEFEALH